MLGLGSLSAHPEGGCLTPTGHRARVGVADGHQANAHGWREKARAEVSEPGPNVNALKASENWPSPGVSSGL